MADASLIKALIIEARYYTHINDLLLGGAQQVFNHHDIPCDVISVPGALEIPAALNFARQSEKYDCYVLLGCIIRGETTHYDVVQNESAKGIYTLVLDHNLAVGNAILTVENEDQALVRADRCLKNKGGEAAEVALKMLALKRQLLKA